MTVRRVVRGEHASRIAATNGFRDFETLWQDPSNAKLRSLRNPNVLATGDEICIPAFEQRVDEAMTTKRHVFVVKRSPLFLRLRLSERLGLDAPTGMSTTASVDDRPTLVGAHGAVDFPISPFVDRATVALASGASYEVRVGDLEPVDTVRGWECRLVNLGYLRAEADPESIEVRSAIEEFQCDEGVAVTGFCDADTQSRLLEAHGI